MKQFTEAELRELLSKAYQMGFKDCKLRVFERHELLVRGEPDIGIILNMEQGLEAVQQLMNQPYGDTP